MYEYTIKEQHGGWVIISPGLIVGGFSSEEKAIVFAMEEAKFPENAPKCRGILISRGFIFMGLSNELH